MSDLRPSLDPDYESVAHNTNRMPGESARHDAQEPGTDLRLIFHPAPF